MYNFEAPEHIVLFSHSYILYWHAYIHALGKFCWVSALKLTNLAPMPSANAWSKKAMQNSLHQNQAAMLCNEKPCWVWGQVHSNISAHHWHWCLWVWSHVDSRCKQPFKLQLVKSNMHHVFIVTKSFATYCQSCWYMNRWMRSLSGFELAFSTFILWVGLT